MSTVHVDLRQLDLSGGGADPIGGNVIQAWIPTRVIQEDTYSVLPGRSTVELPLATGIVNVLPTEPGWAYRVETFLEGTPDGLVLTEYVLVPDLEDELEYSQLERVNPRTLDPATTTAAWVATVQQMIDEAVGGGGVGVLSVNGQAGVVVLDASDVGAASTVQGAKADTAVQPSDLADVATSGVYGDLTGKPTLGTAAATAVTDYATAAQGDTADTAVQPGDLSDVATSGAYADLTGKPTLGTAAAQDSTTFATAAQGTTADSAVQPGDLAAIATSGDAADLTGTLPTSVLPALVVNETFTVGSQAAMLALTAQRGDMAIRTDNGNTYVLSADTPTVLAAWKEVLAAGQITSVNGQTGIVVLAKGDVGLGNVDNTADLAKPISTATQTALNAKADSSALTAHTGNTSNPHGVTKTQVGLGNVDNTSNVTERAASATLTNKRITKRVALITSTGTLNHSPDSYDGAIITAQAAPLTITASGSPTSMQPAMFRIKDDGTARAITWNAVYRAVGVTLPTTTVVGKTLYIGAVYNSQDTKWDVVAVAQEA